MENTYDRQDKSLHKNHAKAQENDAANALKPNVKLPFLGDGYRISSLYTSKNRDS